MLRFNREIQPCTCAEVMTDVTILSKEGFSNVDLFGGEDKKAFSTSYIGLHCCMAFLDIILMLWLLELSWVW